jgi:signal transduction histidine kinase
VSAWWRSAPPVIRDGVGAIALMLVSLIPLGIDGLRLGEMQSEYSPWVSVVLIAAQTLPLALRRTIPALSLGLIGVAFAVTQVLGAGTGLAGLGLLLALYSCGAHLRRGRWALVAASIAAYIALVVVLIAQRSPEKPIAWVTFAAVLAVPWVTGELVRRWRGEQAARMARAAADADRAARSLLARDLHDIVTHHVTAMVVQSESARYLVKTAEGAEERDEIFASVASTGRLALTELRSLLGTLDPDAVSAGPAALAEAGDISHMVQRLKEMGYPISLRHSGTVEEIPSEVIAVMRSVAREAVTNAMKHARGVPVQLVVSVTQNEMVLTVANELALLAAPDAAGSGRGTSGMANRVAEVGGSFTAGVDGDQYVTTARWTR